MPYPPPFEPPPRRPEWPPVVPGAPLFPVAIPVVDVPGGHDPFERLFEQRRVFLRGRLDGATVTRLAAELMALDGESARDVTLVISSPGGPLDDVWSVLDVLAVMRAPVHTTALGQAAGTAAGVLACGTGRRRVAAHATVTLRLSEPDELRGTADEVRVAAEQLAARRGAFAQRLADATGRPVADLAGALDHGPVLSAAEACAVGIADEVLSKP